MRALNRAAKSHGLSAKLFSSGGDAGASSIAEMRLGILISGRGSNFEAIANAIARRKLEAEIAIVISNRASAAGLEVARQLRGIPLRVRLRPQDSTAIITLGQARH